MEPVFYAALFYPHFNILNNNTFMKPRKAGSTTDSEMRRPSVSKKKLPLVRCSSHSPRNRRRLSCQTFLTSAI
ncbi:hypothetical protein L5515_017096 [Caenorhabditis briggsae]|uniref:Uncharacterized protein n=1 Tax=Caenorhabditis briggsae TaxID=6238 RepID=A0AAE8ZLA4_CAEBR|nr:hypothetical protein L3Y34_011223 [Caenorhabditis briggsae]UMM40480.1 hypothetical protein L5515_017096 [Caenorhabditis briggsae]